MELPQSELDPSLMKARRILPAVLVAGALTVAGAGVIAGTSSSPAGTSSSPGSTSSSPATTGSSSPTGHRSFVSAGSQAQEATSANWAGYAVGDTSSPFSSVSGSWVEPTDDCTGGQSDAAFWVGLGGTAEQSDSLEQIGTEADCSASGNADYFAWYELVPSAPVRLGLAIQPGDHVSARVAVSGTNVTVSLSDQTSGQSVTKTLQMSDPDTSSAEWIAEAPSTCGGSGTSDCQPLPLADFGNVTFTSASATAGGHTGTISDSSWSAQPVELSGGYSGARFGFSDPAFASGSASGQSSASASPTTLSSDGSSFAVSWSASSLQSPATASGGDAAGGGDYGGGGYGGSYGF